MNPDPEEAVAVRLAALQTSEKRLRGLVDQLEAEQLSAPSYDDDWTIADVLSHIGSGAEILHRRLDDTLAGLATEDTFASSTWDRWNAKSPAAQAADALVADQALIDRFGSLSASERAGLEFSIGPMTLDLAGVIALRVNEHGLHTWDIEVALDQTATLPPEVTDVVIDNLEMIARFSGKPLSTERTWHLHTTGPHRTFALAVATDSVSLSAGDGAPTVEIPAEAFIRLVYGRLDHAHTPSGFDEDHLGVLREVFPGI